nr:hypothetical protein [Micromonospora sp. DSM 115978]
MSNLPSPLHPPWCRRGPDCAGPGDLHLSSFVGLAARDEEVIQVRLGLWRMEVGPTPPSGLLLDLSVGSEVSRWPVGLAQSRRLAEVSSRLIRRVDPGTVRAA